MDPVLLFAILTSVAFGVECYPGGAPPAACGAMTPHHKQFQPQNGKPPYEFIINKTSESTVKIIIKAEKEFKGFFIQARSHNDTNKILPGTFQTSNNSKLVNCEYPESALTHNSRDPKKEIETEWTSPDNFIEDIVFRISVVQEYSVFWVNWDSEKIQISNQVNSTTESTLGISSTTEAYTEDWYDNCGNTTGCFGMPDGCIQKRSCEVLVFYYKNKKNAVHFRLVGVHGSNDGWIAVGFNNIQKMSPGLVNECVLSNGSIPKVRQSWNYAEPQNGNKVLQGMDGVTEGKASYENGVLICQWERALVTEVNNFTFDFQNHKYYLLLAKGPMDENGDKIYHGDNKLASKSPVNLTEVAIITGKSDLLLKLHGSLMTITWMGLISISIFIARHYKDVWDNCTVLDKKLWFVLHQGFMILSVVLTITAFIVIFVYKDGWSSVVSNPHPILGCVVMALAIVQPIMAIFRPDPTASKRPIFNWAHFLAGNGAHIIAVINVFFATSLSSLNLPKAFLWISVAFVFIHCSAHIIMEVYKRLFSHTKAEKLAINKNKFTVNSYSDEEDREKKFREVFKTFFLGIYVVLVIGFVASLVIIIIVH